MSKYTVPMTQTCEVTDPKVRAELVSKCVPLERSTRTQQLTMQRGVEFLSPAYMSMKFSFIESLYGILNLLAFAGICDRNALAHGDIKYANVLYINHDLKFIDFDLMFSYVLCNPPMQLIAGNWRDLDVFPPFKDLPTAVKGEVGYFPPECSAFIKTYLPHHDANSSLTATLRWLTTALSPALKSKLYLFSLDAQTDYHAFLMFVFSQPSDFGRKKAAFHPDKHSVYQLGIMLANTLHAHGYDPRDPFHAKVLEIINAMTHSDPRRRITLAESIDAVGILLPYGDLKLFVQTQLSAPRTELTALNSLRRLDVLLQLIASKNSLMTRDVWDASEQTRMQQIYDMVMPKRTGPQSAIDIKGLFKSGALDIPIVTAFWYTMQKLQNDLIALEAAITAELLKVVSPELLQMKITVLQFLKIVSSYIKAQPLHESLGGGGKKRRSKTPQRKATRKSLSY